MLATLATGSVICDRYRIRGVLGRGGMGVVFKAEDTALRRMVALKLVTVESAFTTDDTEPRTEERFLREASLNAQIAHPNVVTIYDYGRGEHGVDAFCYIAMELLDGETVGHRLRRLGTCLSMRETLLVATHVGRGLRAAHQRGLVHRDLKPDNVMLTPGEDGEEVARILDFGLAKDTSSEHDACLTDAGTILGTPEYMAPEQVEAREVDARTDLYSLGIMLFECITGAPPFRGPNAFRVAVSHVREPLPAMTPPPGAPKPSPALEDLVRKLLAKRPDARIQTADEVLRRLRELPEAKAVHAREAEEALSLATESRYQTGRKLAESPRSVVHEATHLELGRQVAIKVYRATHPNEIARLRRELPGLALLRHASNVRVLDVGMTSKRKDARPFLVMERVRGPTLAALLSKHGKLAWRRAVDIVLAILEGLGEAHTVGLLHRNLSPEHVIVQGEGTRREAIKLIGYRIPDAERTGSEPAPPLVREPRYLAPELLRGSPPSERSDLYAAAVILHELVLGRAPGSGVDTLRRSERPPETSSIPPALAEVLRRSVSMDPSERFDSASELVDALSEVRSSPRGAEDSMSDDAESASRISTTQRRLRSTGQPTIWFLTGDPALRKPPMTDVLLQLRATLRVEEITADHRAALAARLCEEEEVPPWVVVFGGMHVILEDPLLAVLSRTPEVSRLLVSTHANQELLEGAINFCGLDHHITLPAEPDAVASAIDRLVQRTGAARRYYDDLRLGAQRNTPLPGPAASLPRRVERLG